MPLGIWRVIPHNTRPERMRARQCHHDEAEIRVCDVITEKDKGIPSSNEKSNEVKGDGFAPFLQLQLHSKKPDRIALIHNVSCTSLRAEKRVSFSEVQVRIYELIPGDNPDCSFPLSLGWKHSKTETWGVDAYEKQGKRGEHSGCDFFRAPLSQYERRLRLRSLGFTEKELRQAERKRRVELCLQWSYGQFPKSEDYPYSHHYFLNYIL